MAAEDDKPLNCHAFKDLLVHFQADELPESRRRQAQAHLDACPTCARRMEVEEAFLGALRERLGRRTVPPGLETRIRSTLEAQRGGTRERFSWWRRPWVAATAAAVLLTVLLIPGIDGLRSRTPDAGAGVVHVAADVLVVDLDCDRAGRSLAQQRNCRNPRHLNALRTANGVYWNISQDYPLSRELLFDAEMRGHRIHVEGDYFPGIHTVLLRRHSDLGLESL